jgi:hypothetical protein
LLQLVVEAGSIMLPGEVVSFPGDLQVGTHRRFAFLTEVVTNDAGHELKVVFGHSGSSTEGSSVDHDPVTGLFGDFRQRHREKLDPPFLQILSIYFKLFVVDDPSSGHDLALVPFDGFWKEGQQQVNLISMGV